MPEYQENDKTHTHVALTPGVMVSHYRIVEKIGAGGMGEVYHAEDTELNRKVALKFLPLHLCQSEECRARFKREAQAAAKLDHPNIVAVHEVGEFQGRPFFSMQHVEGQSLKEVLSGKALPLDRILEIGNQVCDGLQAAHESGVTHRDIKPSNILIDSHGRARIVDFGLASVMGLDHLTKTGSTLGTIGYMSPEQVRGDKVDHRTDLFSCGVVLYEMITGNSPFKADSEAATLHAITNTTPEPLARFRREVPPALQVIVDKALDKEIATRYQHADELAADLKRLVRQSDRLLLHSVPPTRPSRRPLFVGGAALLVIVISLLLLCRKQEAVSTITRRQLTFVGKVSQPQISPDGKWLAYINDVSANEKHLCVSELSGGEPLVIHKANNIYWLRWSPDGSMMIFAGQSETDFGTFEIRRLGGSPRKLGGFTFAGYSSDGNEIAGTRIDLKLIVILDKSTQQVSKIAPSGEFTWLQEIDWSPNDDYLAYTALFEGGTCLSVIRVDGTGQVDLLRDSLYLSCPRWADGGRAIYYFRANGPACDLMRLDISRSGRSAAREPVIVQSGLLAGSQFSMSADGRLFAYCQEQRFSNLWLADLTRSSKSQVEVRPLSSGTSTVRDARISPDGSRIAYSKGSGTESNIFVASIDGTDTKQLTFMKSLNSMPVWSPDGSRIAFASSEGNRFRVWQIDPNGGVPRAFEETQCSGAGFFMAWAPCDQILYEVPGHRNFSVFDPKSGVEHRLITNDSLGWMFSPVGSPDCRHVAVFWNRKVSAGLWVISMDGVGQTLLAEGQHDPRGWSRDGQKVFANFEGGPTLLAYPLGGGKPDTLFTLPADEIEGGCMSADETKYAYIRPEKISDVWLIENFDPDAR